MVTSNDRQDQVESALAAGVDAYLIKPIVVDSLREAIGDSLTKGAARTIALGADDDSPNEGEESELDAMFGMLEGILSNAPAGTSDATAEPDAAIDPEMQNRLNILMGKLSDQLASFVTSYDSATPEKLRVMQLASRIHGRHPGRKNRPGRPRIKQHDHRRLENGHRYGVRLIRSHWIACRCHS